VACMVGVCLTRDPNSGGQRLLFFCQPPSRKILGISYFFGQSEPASSCSPLSAKSVEGERPEGALSARGLRSLSDRAGLSVYCGAEGVVASRSLFSWGRLFERAPTDLWTNAKLVRVRWVPVRTGH